ncbi:hypothetical protein ACNJX9_01685 [Bradyrhizobium sp. DASA03076]|uniref:Alpha 1,4-glycosyltransferase domain-containing protein n=1 Tax=Bradyrhizobium manausense TaxID=989370 RepID=A0A0R3E625_9BRAD|nr:hypothetical protein [Bradyrhizobium manausense]KRQ17590.1 hypothetical protein AOQ71_00955 [Bradyrhizobium manausense]
MLPEIVTFWHGPMDALRQTCLRSQLAAGHKVTVYSFDTIPGLPAGVENADAEAILPHAFSERLRPPQPDGSWRDWTTLQFSDFFRIKLMAKHLGLWLDADVLLLKPVEIDPAEPYFAWERSRRLGNSVLYLPPDHQIVGAFENLMAQEELTPEWLSPSHRLSFAIRKLSGGSQRLSDLRIAIFGPPALTILAKRSGDLQKALPKRSFYAVHSEPRLFFEPSSYLGIVTDPNVIGLHISGKGRSLQPPIPGSLFAWAVERFG